MMRSLGFCLLAVLVLGTGSGCRRNEPAAQTPPKPQMVDKLGHIHWLGGLQIAADTNSSHLMKIVGSPEAASLGKALLTKLARAPWRWFGGTTNLQPAQTNAARLLEPMLKALLENECYLELQRRTNEAPELALAMKLPPEQADLWETNCGLILSALVGVNESAERAEPRVWQIKRAGYTNTLSINRSGSWTIVFYGPETNSLGSDFSTRIQRDGEPFPARSTNYWLEADLDGPGLLSTYGLGRSLVFPTGRVEFAVIGDGEFLRTRGTLRFPRPLNLQFEPWNIPTNMIREPLVSFAALQGIRPWLEQFKWIQDLHLTNPPDQFFAWAIAGTQPFTFAATPMPGATADIDRVGPELEGRINAWLTNNALNAAEFSKENSGISWIPVPLFTPTFQALKGAGGEILFGRLAPTLPPPGKLAPPELLDRVTSRTNLVYYEWEITESRLNQWLFIGQSARLAFRRAQVPGDSVAFRFLETSAPKLGNMVTEVVLRDPVTLEFVRKSHLGFSGVELHVLADWAESPDFPFGFHSEAEIAQPILRYNAKSRSFERTTNSPAVK